MSNTGKPDPLGAILKRLNGTVVKVTKLRQSLEDLETELSEIRQLCEDEINAHAVSSTVVTVADHIVPTSRTPSGPVSTSIPPILGVASSSVVSQGLGLPIPVSHSLGTAALYHPPQPPTEIFPFPESIDLSSYPSEHKREGDNWFVLSNPSPKVKRVLDVHLVHELVFDARVQCVGLSRDGKWLAVGSLRAAHIYDVNTGVEICVLDHGDGFIWKVCFSPDGKYLATAANRHVWIWDIDINKILTILEGYQDFVSCLHFSPNGQFIVSASDDRSVHIWGVDGRLVKVLTINDHYSPEELQAVVSVAISPDGRYVAAGSKDMIVNIWEITTGVLVQKLRGHRDHVSSVAFTPDGKGLISGSLDGTLKYWDISGLGIGSGVTATLTSPLVISPPPCLLNLTGHRYAVCSIAVSHDGDWVVSTSTDATVLFSDMRTGVAHCLASGHAGIFGLIELSLMGNFLVTAGSWDDRVRVWSYGICS